MLSNNPAEPQGSPLGDAEAGAAEDSTPVMNPRGTIEVASGGNGTVNDPPGADIKPPFTPGFELPV